MTCHICPNHGVEACDYMVEEQLMNHCCINTEKVWFGPIYATPDDIPKWRLRKFKTNKIDKAILLTNKVSKEAKELSKILGRESRVESFVIEWFKNKNHKSIYVSDVAMALKMDYEIVLKEFNILIRKRTLRPKPFTLGKTPRKPARRC